VETKKATTKKKGSRRKPGLWFSATKIEVQDVKSAHKKKCNGCGCTPVFRRLMVTKGAGRHATTEVFCTNCGFDVLEHKRLEADRAQRYLLGKLDDGEGIRL
jgi:hypothetical protein